MLDWDLERLRAVGGDHEGSKIFRVGADEGEVGTFALLEINGFKPVTYGAEMSRPITGDLPAAQLRAGLELKAVTSEHLRLIGRPISRRSEITGATGLETKRT